MDKQREKLPQLLPDSEESDAPVEESASRIPEEATEIYELVEESEAEAHLQPAEPAPAPRPKTPELPEETLQELRALRAKIDHKDRQIEQVMEAYRGKKEETEKLRKRIEKTERRKFEQSKGQVRLRLGDIGHYFSRAVTSRFTRSATSGMPAFIQSFSWSVAPLWL